MTDLIVLREYESTAVELDAASAAAIARATTGMLTITPTSTPGFFSMTAAQFVGTIVLPQHRILIRPKVPLENLFFMLEAGLDNVRWGNDRFSFERHEQLLAAFATIFEREVHRATSRGLLHAYRAFEEPLLALRGRVDVPAMLRRRGVLVPVDCQFDEFTPDIPENRLVKAAIRRLLMVPGVWQPTRRGLRVALAQFEPVGEDANPTIADRFRPNRLNRHYQALMKLAAVVVRATSLVDRAGTVGAESFLIDMNRLFQDFVIDRLRRHLTGGLEVQAEPRIALDIHGSVEMSPDIVIRSRGERLLVADTKYKLLDDKLHGRNADYYQLLAYTTALDRDEGLLIYCLGDQAEGEDHLRTVTVRHAGKRLTTVRVDLSGPRSELEASMRSLAELVRSLANESLGRHRSYTDARWLDRNRVAS